MNGNALLVLGILKNETKGELKHNRAVIPAPWKVIVSCFVGGIAVQLIGD